MYIQFIRQYYAEVEGDIKFSGSRTENVLRQSFHNLLNKCAISKHLKVIPNLEYLTPRKHKIYPDGTIKNALRLDIGFWESKDEKDKLEEEIELKFAKGYPSTNILFEDSKRAILYQDDKFVMNASFDNEIEFDEILSLFIGYESKEVQEYHKAIELFKADIPKLASSLRDIIDEQITSNPNFTTKLDNFWELCKNAINPKVDIFDVREMIIQHILTEDIFLNVFNEADFHRENIIAKNLQEVVNTFYTGISKRNIHNQIAHYYETINAKAAQISDHHEKQKFLKELYGSFYAAYNPEAADRLGVIYTPDEIVRFMVKSTDYLLNQHFCSSLGEPNVEILDPATGTGTFITEIIDSLPNALLENKYENELHCNEVAILPYYIANLNIEFTYKQKTGKFKEFNNICFVDTLDNTGFTREGTYTLPISGYGFTDENAERIRVQNDKRISVIITNPPYNARQMNYNYQNANRPYPYIDDRIKETYIKEGTAQNKNAVYDMYTRFLRWASDRLDKNGIIAFVSNNSFVVKSAFDGVRKTLEKEFNEIYIINLKGEARGSGEPRKQQGGNIFHNEIKVGIAIYFLIRKEGQKGCKVYINEVNDYTTAIEKLDYISEKKVDDLNFKLVNTDKENSWLNQLNQGWSDLIPLSREKNSIFNITSNGVKTQRDEWVYDFSIYSLRQKMEYFIEIYNKSVENSKFTDKMKIKWDSDLDKYRDRNIYKIFDTNSIVQSIYRPFVKMNLYLDRHFNGRTYQWFSFYERNVLHPIISINIGSTEFSCLATNYVIQMGTLLVGGGNTQCYPLYRLTKTGQLVENISDWALKNFRNNYELSGITKQDIFYYVYAILNSPTYRKKYKNELTKKEARIPFNKNFGEWVQIGKQLMELHISFETATPYPINRKDEDPIILRKPVIPILIARKETNSIEIDTITTLMDIPKESWDYKFGSYSAIEWILERYKEKTPKDPTIREKFNTYKFAEYKEHVIDLIGRVCTVSVETMKIIKEMEKTGE